MIKILIGLIIATPFFILPNMDTREPKMILALIGASILTLSVFYFKGFKPVRNKWFLLFLAYLPICIFFSPKPAIDLMGIPVANFWVWKASLVFVIFSLFIISIYSMDFQFKDKLLILKVMVWCGFIMSLYMILQYFGFDQFFISKNMPISSLPPSFQVGGTMGHPTIVSPFVAMIIPLAIYLRKYIFAIVMIVAICLSKSYVAIGAMCVMFLFLLALRSKMMFILITVLSILSIAAIGDLYRCEPKVKAFIVDKASGRLNIWKQAIGDISKPIDKEKKITYSYTGFGPGSFYYIFHIRHSDGVWNFFQAHNEYIELGYDTGFIGLGLFLMAIFSLFWTNLIGGLNRYRKYLLASFVCILISAGGTFVFHIAPIIVYSSIIVALLSKPKQEEELGCVS